MKYEMKYYYGSELLHFLKLFDESGNGKKNPTPIPRVLHNQE